METIRQVRELTALMADFTSYVSRHLPDDVAGKLKELGEAETSPLAKKVYDAMLENQRLAAKLSRPCCQDTGVIQYFVEAGAHFPLLGELSGILRCAALAATKKAPLRHNAVEIFDEVNTGNNTGYRVPWIDWHIVSGSEDALIHVYLAGGGCSLPGAARVLMPGEGYEGIVSFVFDVISSYGVNACPPLLVGIGIAGSVEVAATLSKRALLRPIGSHNHKRRGAEMERLLEDGLNALGVGPQGLTGENSVLGVHIEDAARHPSTIGAAVSTGCWSHRRGTIRVHGDLSYEILTHKGAAR